MVTEDVFETVRQPEYTGANRCIPCTVTNVAIAAAASVVISIASPLVGVAAFALFAGVIYLRGYLVPGTPALTKRYFPDRVLAWFDKEPAPEYTVPREDVAGDELDVESALLGAGALEQSDDADDFRLHPDFRERWYDEMDGLDEPSALRTLGNMLDVPEESLSTQNHGKAHRVNVDGEGAGIWESREAFVADMAAERVLAERAENWTELSVGHRSGLLRSLRVYLGRCPRCGSRTRMTEETVESCCRSRQVFATNCEECDVRLFEIDASEVATSDV